jgi:hypothetical protein
MIDPAIEEIFPLVEARAVFPPVRHRSASDPGLGRAQIGMVSLIRLCNRGDRNGVRLESLKLSGVRYTSRQAIARYLRAASEAQDRAPAKVPSAARAVRKPAAKK